MRDNPYHKIPLLGAGWGANLMGPGIRDKWRSSWKNILNHKVSFSSRRLKGPDQTILTRHIWSWGKDMSLQHDSYTCKQYPGSVGFPTQRKNEEYNFIAAVGPMRLWKECPEMCRRKKEWTFC